MLTVKANLTALSEYDSNNTPTSVSILLNEEDIDRIKEAIAYLKKSGATYVKIRKTADLYHCSKDVQDEEYLNNSTDNEEYQWEESSEGLKIFLGSIYYEAINDYNGQDIAESEDLTELCPELSALFKDEQEQKVIGYYVYGSEQCAQIDDNGNISMDFVETREFNTIEERNEFSAGVIAGLGWDKAWVTNPNECNVEDNKLILK